MKNRRLNVLFIAIIALAAAPQAMHDAYRLVSAAHERAEMEFWSIFLSYQMPESDSAQNSDRTELVAARSQQGADEACPVEVAAARPVEATRASQPGETRTRAKAEVGRTNAEDDQSVSETAEADLDNADEVANVYTTLPIEFSEKEQKAVKAAGLHARDTEKITDAASRASMASFVQENELKIRAKQIVDVDKLRQRTRNNKERGESLYEIPAPNTIGSM